MNTGHEGGCGTVHANSTADIPARLEALASLGGLPRAALHAQLASALDAVIHVARDDSGVRRVAEISIFVREPRSGASAASVPSSSALTAAACWGRVAGSWNGCSNVDHDHDQSRLRSAGCLVDGTSSSGAKSSQPTRSTIVWVRYGCTWQEPNAAAAIMDTCRNLDHLAGPDRCRRLSRRSAGCRTGHRNSADRGNCRPAGCSAPTTKLSPPSPS